METHAEIREEIIRSIPSLRAFALSLARAQDRADDLVQDTMLRAFGRLDSFEPGTNLQAWLFTILRNAFYSDVRKRRREVDDADGFHAARLMSAPGQESSVLYADFLRAFAQLNADQREALVLVVAAGFPFEDAAQIMGVALGTAKSRVIRARARLAELMGLDSDEDLGPDRNTRAVLQATP